MQLDDYLPQIRGCGDDYSRSFYQQVLLRESASDRFKIYLDNALLFTLDVLNGANTAWFVYENQGVYSIRSVAIMELWGSFDCRPVLIQTMLDNLDTVPVNYSMGFTDRMELALNLAREKQ